MRDINTAKANIDAIGFLEIDIDINIDLFAAIEKLKKEKNAIVLVSRLPAQVDTMRRICG